MKQEQKVTRGTDGIALDNAALRRHRARGNGGWMPNRVYRQRPGLRQLAMLNIRRENRMRARGIEGTGGGEGAKGRRYNNFL